MKHLAIFDAETVRQIFSGKKKLEGRFSKIKIAPFLQVSAGDVVLMKISGEKIVGEFLVDRVFHYDHPTQEEVDYLKRKYGRDLALPQSFWLSHEKTNFVTLMFIGKVSTFIIAPEVAKKDLRPWVVLG